MGHYIPLSCTPEFKKRCKEHFPNGTFSKWIVELATKDLDRLDGLEAIRNQHQKWIDKVVRPFVEKYCGNGELYPLIGDRQLEYELKEAGIIISAPDLKLCIEKMMMEAEHGITE